MASVAFKQGEDKIISVQVVKAGLPVALNACPNIKAILKIGDSELKKYALISEVNYGTLNVSVTPTNEANIIVEREHSKLFPIGQLSLVLLCSFNDPAFDDGIRVEEYKFNVGQVLKGEATQEIIP